MPILTTQQDAVLRVLEGSRDPWLTPRQIAEALGHRQPTGVGRVCWQLERLGRARTYADPARRGAFWIAESRWRPGGAS